MEDVDYNYFHYYAIKPSETDPAKIDVIIKKKASDTNPKYPRLARDLKNDAEEILVKDSVFDERSQKYIPNSGGREKERQALKRLVLKNALNYLQNSSKSKKIVLYSLIQKITDSQENSIAGENIFTFDELLAEAEYLKKQGFQFIDENKGDPFASFEGMDQYFVTLNIKDLYEYLGVSFDATDKEIQDALTKKKTEWAKLPTSDRNRKNAYSKLNGKIPLIIQKSDQRILYDYYIAFYDDIWSKLKAKRQYNDFDMEFDEFTNFVSLISSKAKLTSQEANKIMVLGLHHYSINLVGGNEDSELDCCPHCGKLFAKGLKVCPHCGTNLEILCWNCSQPISIAAKVCPHCGVSKNLETNFDKARKELDFALKEIPIDENKIDSCYLTLKNVYSKYEEHKGCKIDQVVEEYLPKVQKRKEEKKKIDDVFENTISKMMDLSAQKKFVEASSLLQSAKKKLPSYDFKKYEISISQSLTKAKAYLDSAKRKMGCKDCQGAILDAMQSLDICSDYQEASLFLKAYPPTPVSDLSVTCSKEGAHLKWNSVTDKNVTYTIIRKTMIPPKSNDDGNVVVENLTFDQFIDSSLVSGVPTYYAVFTSRRGVCSKICVTSTPALTFLNVSGVHQEIKDGVIRVLFKKPSGCETVRIRKKAGSYAPESLSDGEEVKCSDNVFEVEDKESDVYSFFVVCEYLIKGKKQYSSPLKFTFKKTTLPKPLKIVSVETKGNSTQLQIQYENLQKDCEIELYSCKDNCDFDFDTPDENVNFLNKYKNLKKVDFLLGENKILYQMEENSLVFLYPVVRNESLYVISKPILANSINGIQSLNIINGEGKIKIEGTLNEDARELIAVLSLKGYVENPEEKDPSLIKRTCSKDDFDKAGGFFLTLSPGVYYLTLFAKFLKNSEVFFSAPNRVSHPINCKKKTPLKYCLEGQIDLYHKKKIKVCFRSQVEGKVGDCEIYCGFPRPQSKNSGVLLGKIPGGVLKKKLFSSEYTYSVNVEVLPLKKKEDRIALFFAQEDDDFYLQMVDR